MKVLFVDYKHVYDRNWKRTNQSHAVNYYFEYMPLTRTVEGLYGGKVVPFWLDEEILAKGRAAAAKELLEVTLREKPDIAIFHSSQEFDVTEETLQAIKEKTSVITVYIAGEDSWCFDLISKHFAHYFSWIVTYCGAAVERYNGLGCRQVLHTQVGVDLNVYRPLPRKKDIDVSFIGIWTKPRAKIIEYLKKNGIRVWVRGGGWPEGRLEQDEVIDIISRSKIGLSLNPPAFTFGWRQLLRLLFRRAYVGEAGLPYKFDGHHFFQNMRAWLQKRIWQVKSRQFEIPACRTMEITHDADDLRDFYEPGKEIVFYEDLPDLVKKIKYYLVHDGEREEIASRGYERTIAEHTAEKRFEAIFGKILAQAQTNKQNA